MTALPTMNIICLSVPKIIMLSFFTPITFDLSTNRGRVSSHNPSNFSKTFALIQKKCRLSLSNSVKCVVDEEIGLTLSAFEIKSCEAKQSHAWK